MVIPRLKRSRDYVVNYDAFAEALRLARQDDASRKDAVQWAEEIQQKRRERAIVETGPKEDLCPLP